MVEVALALFHPARCRPLAPASTASNVGAVSKPDESPAPADSTSTDTGPRPASPPQLDLGAIERDLAAVEAALPRLDDGSYWVDEVTGEEIPDSTLAADPLTRRA